MASEYTERVKIDAFTDGIRDPDTRRAVVLSPKSSFAETIVCALINETANNIIKPAVKIRRVDMEPVVDRKQIMSTRPSGDWRSNKFRNGNSRIRCWACNRMGHISLECWLIRRTRARTPSPMFRRAPEERKVAVEGERATASQALSRQPHRLACKQGGQVENKENIINVRLMRVLPVEGWTNEEIRNEQREDPDLSIVIGFLEKEQRPEWSEISDKSPTVKAYWTQWDSLLIEDGCLKRTWKSSNGKTKHSLVVVPRIRISKILAEYHGGASGGHVGINKTVAKVRERFYWTGCRRSVEKWCQRCNQCRAVKGPAKRNRGTRQKSNVRKFPSSALCEQEKGDRMKEESNNMDRIVRDKKELPGDKARARCDVRASNQGFKEGQLVWLHNSQRWKGSSRKIQSKWEGPYKIITRINDVVYRVQRGVRGKPKVVRLKRLALYRGGDLDPVRDEQVWAEGSVTNHGDIYIK